MKLVSIFLIMLFTTTAAEGASKLKCKKNYEFVSCEGVENAKRKSVCLKTGLSEEKKTKYCQTDRKYKKKKSNKKKKSVKKEIEADTPSEETKAD